MTPDATAVVTAVRAVLTTQLAWQGTATELLLGHGDAGC